MTVRRMLGIVLIVLGTWLLLNEPMRYMKRDKEVDVRSIDATAERQKPIPFLRVLGGIATITGVVILITSVRDRS